MILTTVQTPTSQTYNIRTFTSDESDITQEFRIKIKT